MSLAAKFQEFNRGTKQVSIPELADDDGQPVAVTIRALPFGRFTEVQTAMVAPQASSMLPDILARAIKTSTFDADGKPVFGAVDVDAIKKLDPVITGRLVDEILKLSGAKQEDVEALRKN